jgi:hypothetical protein
MNSNIRKMKRRNKGVLKYMMKNRKHIYNIKTGDYVALKDEYSSIYVDFITGFRFKVLEVDNTDNTLLLKDKYDNSGDYKYYDKDLFEKEKLDLDIINVYKNKM